MDKINLHYTIIDKGFEMDLRELPLIRRFLIGLGIIRKRKIVILGKNIIHGRRNFKKGASYTRRSS